MNYSQTYLSKHLSSHIHLDWRIVFIFFSGITFSLFTIIVIFNIWENSITKNCLIWLLLSIVIILSLYEFFADRLMSIQFENLSELVYSLLYVFIISIVLFTAFQFNKLLQDSLARHGAFARAFIIAICFLVIFTDLLWIGSILQYKPKEVKAKKNGKFDFLYFSIPAFAIWTLYLFAFWPAIMSADSTDQWMQAHTQIFSDGHPVFHTLLIWFLTRFIDSPAFIAFIQLLLLALVGGYSFATLYHLGVGRKLIWFACLVYAFSPVTSIWSITLWKDIPFSISMLLTTTILLKIIYTRGEWLKPIGNSVILGVLCTLVALLRHNGLFIFLLPIILIPFYIRYIRKLLVSMAVLILIYFVVTGPLFTTIKVTRLNARINFYLTMSIPIYIVEANQFYGTPINQQDMKMLQEIYPTPWPYYPYVPVINNGFNWDALWKNRENFNQLVIRLCLQNPKDTITAFINKGSIIWEIVRPKDSYMYNAPPLIDSNLKPSYITNPIINLGVISNPQLASLWFFLAQKIETHQYASYSVWRPAQYLYLLLIINTLLAIRFKNVRLLLLSVPAMLNSMLLMILIPVQDSRFQFPVILCCMVLWPLIGLVKNPPKDSLFYQHDSIELYARK